MEINGNLFSDRMLPDIHEDFNENYNIVLHEGNAIKFCQSLPDKSLSLIITSPPYNIGKVYEVRKNIDDYLSEQKQLIEDFDRVLKDDGSICWEVGNYIDNGEVYPLDIFFYKIFKDCGFKLRNRIIWHFGHGLHTQKRFSGRYETIIWFTKTDKYKFNLDPVRIPVKYPGKRQYKGVNKGKPSSNPMGKNPSDVWEFVIQDWDNLLWDIPNVKSNHPEKTNHPCQFPIELVERCVLALTDKDDWVYDPYCGVGSSLIAGLLYNRKVAGSDKEKEYIELAKKRIFDLYNGDLKIRPLGKPVFVPTGKEKISQIPEEWKNIKVNLSSKR